MKIKNLAKSLEEKLNDSYKETNESINSQDFQDEIEKSDNHYKSAPGSYVPNMNKQRHIYEDQVEQKDDFQEDLGEDYVEHSHPNSIRHLDDEPYKSFHNYKLYMGENTPKIYSEDYIEDYIDGSLKVPTDYPSLKLVDSDLKNELKELANLLKICDRYIKKRGDRVITAFRDGVEMLRAQFEEGMSHLHQATYKSDIIIGDFIQDNAIRTWHLKQFNESLKPLLQKTFDFLKEFEDGRKILDIV